MRAWIGLAGLLMASAPAQAEVASKSAEGFVVRVSAHVTSTPDQSWRTIVVPAQWWVRTHTFSGDSANLTLDPVPGGCFCEKLPLPKGAAKGDRPGGVQHLRVLYAEPGKALRFSGALGPLQSEALNATLTITIKPTENGSRILFEYVVGGFMRYNVDEIAPAVDKVMSAQLASLAVKLGPVNGTAPSSDVPVSSGSEGASTEVRPSSPPSRTDARPQIWSLPPGKGRTGTQTPAKPAPKPAALSATTGLAAGETLSKPSQGSALATKAPVKATPRPAAKPVAKAGSKPPAKAAPARADQEHQDANAAFDALLGGNVAPPGR